MIHLGQEILNKQLIFDLCLFSRTRFFVDFFIDVREGFRAVVFLPHFIVKSVVEHLPKFLLCHVRVRIHHLESREEKFFNAKLTNSQYVNLKVVTITSSVKCKVMG